MPRIFERKLKAIDREEPRGRLLQARTLRRFCFQSNTGLATGLSREDLGEVRDEFYG